MSNLSNLYISESYYGVINLIDSTEPFASQSAGKIYFTDGVGENLGVSLDYQKNLTIDNNLIVDGDADFNGNVDISGSLIHTGSIDVIGNITVEGNITAHTASFDTINTRILHVTLESSSVIFSSGSNQLGDEITDVQELIGQVLISGSLSVDGNSVITGSLNVSGEISSSTINGIGNVTSYSQSVDSRLVNLELDSASQDQRLDSLELYTASQDVINNGYNLYTQSIDNKFSTLQTYTSSVDISLSNLNAFTSSQLVINSGYNSFTQSYFVDSASFDQRLDSIEAFTQSLIADFVTEVEYSASIAVVTASLQSQIDTKLDASWTGSVFTPFSSSVDSRINTTNSNITSLSSSIAITDGNQQSQINQLIASTGSYATTGSNQFIGTQNISGSLNVEGASSYTGSLSGNVVTLGVTSSIATMDCNDGNFFTLTLPSGSVTSLDATNIKPGLTVTLQIKQNANGFGDLVFNVDKFKFPRLAPPTITPQNGAIDVLTLVSFDTSSFKGVITNDLI